MLILSSLSFGHSMSSHTCHYPKCFALDLYRQTGGCFFGDLCVHVSLIILIDIHSILWEYIYPKITNYDKGSGWSSFMLSETSVMYYIVKASCFFSWSLISWVKTCSREAINCFVDIIIYPDFVCPFFQAVLRICLFWEYF